MVVGKMFYVDWMKGTARKAHDDALAERRAGPNARRSPKGFREPPLNPGKRLKPAKKAK